MLVPTTSLSVRCPAEVQHFTSYHSRHPPCNSPPPTTPSLPPISRIQHQHTITVGVEKDREGENLPKIILTHNTVVKRDREREVWSEYVSIKIKWCREDKQGSFPTPMHDFHKRTRKQGKLLEGFAFGFRLHSWLLLVRERDKSRKEVVGYVIQTSGRG